MVASALGQNASGICDPAAECNWSVVGRWWGNGQPTMVASRRGMPTRPMAMTNSAPRPSAISARVGRVFVDMADPLFGIPELIVFSADAGDVDCLLSDIDVHAGDADDRKELGGLVIGDVGVDRGADHPGGSRMTGRCHGILRGSDRLGGVDPEGGAMELVRVECRSTGPGRLGGFGCGSLFRVEVATTVDHQSGEREEHGHEDHCHDEELAALVVASRSKGTGGHADRAHEAPPMLRFEPENPSDLLNPLVTAV